MGLCRPAASAAPGRAGRCIWLVRPRAAESAREGAGEPANDLQICSGIIHAVFACGPRRAPGTGSAASLAGATALPTGGQQRAARPPACPPPSLRTVNWPHTQLRSLSPQAEPQMYFMGERLPRQVVKHLRGCWHCPTRWLKRLQPLAAGGGCCCALWWASVRRRVQHMRVQGGRACGCTRGCEDGWWMGVQERHSLAAPPAAPLPAGNGQPSAHGVGAAHPV